MTVTQIGLTARYSLAPTPDPLIGTLLDTATVEDGIEYLDDGRDMFESFNSMTFRRAAVFCGVNAKTFDQSSAWVKAFKMAAYGGVLCNAVGLDVPDQRREIERVFTMGASVAVEAGLMDNVFSPTAAAFPTPVDITPAGGAVKPKLGIALIEGWMGTRYVGAPTIHLPTVIASLVMGVDGVAADEGNILRTKLNSKVVNGAGYDIANVSPANVAAPTGEKWIYGTGEVLVRQGDIISQNAFNQSNNEMVTLAERPYYVAVDGPVVAVRVQVAA